MKIFTGHAVIFSKVPDTFTRKQDHKVLFTTLHLIFSKTRLARFLTPAEITELEQNVINLSTIIYIKFSARPITLKMHDVLVHTIRQAIKILFLILIWKSSASIVVIFLCVCVCHEYTYTLVCKLLFYNE